MIEHFTRKGNWSLPNSESKLSGTLTFSQEEGAQLELQGVLDKIWEFGRHEIIVGQSDKGPVTLVNNLNINSTVANGVISESYIPIFILEGFIFKEIEEIRFSEVIFRLFNLNQWFSQTGIQFNFEDDFNKFSLNYSKPKDINFQLHQNCSGVIYFFNQLQFGERNNISMEEQCFIKLTYMDKVPFTTILEDLHVIQGFFTLILFEQTYPVSISFQDRSTSLRTPFGFKEPIKCYFSNKTYSKKHKIRRKHEHLVKYEDINNELPLLISSWYEKFKKLRPPFFLLLNSFLNSEKVNEEDFMGLVRGIETFHRRVHNNSVLSKSDFKDRINRIIKNEKLTNDEILWIKEKLNFSNEPSLKSRIIELIETYSNYYLKQNIPSLEEFSRRVKDSRNYYTHYDKRLEDKACSGKELLELFDLLKGLLVSCILEYVGFDKKVFENNLKNRLSY